MEAKLALLANKYGSPKTLSDGTLIKPPLLNFKPDSHAFAEELSNFVVMTSNVRQQSNLSAAELWAAVFTGLTQSEYMPCITTLTSIAMVFPIGSVENERVFSMMNFLKDDWRNRMGPELLMRSMRLINALCWIKFSGYTVKSFPYEAALAVWNKAKRRRGQLITDS